MSEPTIDAPDTSQDQPTNDAGTGNENPTPWADYVKDLPESVVPLVEPKFREWDSNVTKRFQQVHSEYEPLKPFKALVDNGLDFDSVQQAVTFAQLVNEDPERVYKALQEQYGYGNGEQGQVEPEPDPSGEGEPDLTKNPEFAKYREMTEQMAQIMLEQQQAAQTQKEQEALEAKLSEMKQAHGEFDEDYVMTKVYNGMTWEQAIGAYNALAQKFQAPSAPVVMGSGGGLPSQQIDPAQMSDKARRDLVAQIAAKANQQT